MVAIKKVKASRPCRVRLYNSPQALAKDVMRPPTMPPKGTQHGLLLDVVLNDSVVMDGGWAVSPLAFVPVPFEQVVMLVEPPAMVKLSLISIEEE